MSTVLERLWRSFTDAPKNFKFPYREGYVPLMLVQRHTPDTVEECAQEYEKDCCCGPYDMYCYCDDTICKCEACRYDRKFAKINSEGETVYSDPSPSYAYIVYVAGPNYQVTTKAEESTYRVELFKYNNDTRKWVPSTTVVLDTTDPQFAPFEYKNFFKPIVEEEEPVAVKPTFYTNFPVKNKVFSYMTEVWKRMHTIVTQKPRPQGPEENAHVAPLKSTGRRRK